jgi:two-component system OmpR family sensor kinase
MSIRSRIVLTVTAIFLTVLVVAGAAAVRLLERQLIGDIDQRLRERSAVIPHLPSLPTELFAHADEQPELPGEDSAGGEPDELDVLHQRRDAAVLVMDTQGALTVALPSGSQDDPRPLPDQTGLRLAQQAGDYDIPLTIDGELPYRVMMTPIEDQAVAVIALPLDEVQATVATTTRILAVVGVTAVITLGVLAWWSVRRGLRPIDDIISTAGNIGAGKWSQRVEITDPPHEVGRLGNALNAMLGRIEYAMRAKTEAEAHLRRFVADASHELRTPLTSIRGYAELYRAGARRPEQVEMAFQRIEHEAERMGAQVDDLLLLAQLDQGRPLASELVDLTRVIEDSIADARAVEPQRPISYTPGMPSRVVVSGDEKRLTQVIANLLSNVRKHTTPITPVQITLTSTDTTATIVIDDEGPGFEPQHAERVFDRYYRVNPNDSPHGTGLGLSIVHDIVTAHNGRVWISSHPGKGTTVTIELPIHHSSPSTETSQLPTAMSSPDSTIHLNK